MIFLLAPPLNTRLPYLPACGLKRSVAKAMERRRPTAEDPTGRQIFLYQTHVINLRSSGFLKPLFNKISLSFKRQLLLCNMAFSILPFNHFVNIEVHCH